MNRTYEGIYEGFYARFDTVKKSDGSLLMGPDNIVGDDYEIFFKTDDGHVVAWLKNKFGVEIGHFDVNASRKLQLANARDMKLRALLSFVAYSDTPDPGLYWGEMAVFCYSPHYQDEFDQFIARVSEKLGEGVRPNIDLGSSAVGKIFEDSNWLPNENVPFPKKETGTAILKDHRSMSEKMIEQGRAGNKGCYAVSIAFIVIVVAAIIYGLHCLGLF